MGAGGGLFRTKSVEQSIRDTDEPDSKLRKDLTARDLTVFGVAVVIGAGIFTLTAQTAGNMAGPAVSFKASVAGRRSTARIRAISTRGLKGLQT